MSWSNKFWGKKPQTIQDYKRLNGVYKFTIVVYIVISLIVLFAITNVVSDLEVCQTNINRMSLGLDNDVRGGFPTTSCEVVDGYVICDVDNYTALG